MEKTLETGNKQEPHEIIWEKICKEPLSGN